MGPRGEGSVPAQLISRSIAYWSLRYHYPMQTPNYTVDMTWLTVTLPFVVNTPYIIQSLLSCFYHQMTHYRLVWTLDRTPFEYGLTKFYYFDSNQKFFSSIVTKWLVCFKQTVWSPWTFRLKAEYVDSDEVFPTGILLRRPGYLKLTISRVGIFCELMYLKFLNTHKSSWLLMSGHEIWVYNVVHATSELYLFRKKPRPN